MPIIPDDKDWTWVLERPCTECGFDAAGVPPTDVAAGLRENAAAWRPLLGHAAVAERPTEDRWSALEYACHVRDVFRLYDQRLALMLEEDDPTFANWDQDVTAVTDRYSEASPTAVVADLEAAGARLASSFDAVAGTQWERIGNRSDGAHFTVATFAQYLLHDPVHHIWDVETGYAAIDGRPAS